MKMYDCDKNLVDMWCKLENSVDIAQIVLSNTYNNSQYIRKISINNDDDQKYLHVSFDDKHFEVYTHIQSFINDFKALHGEKVFESFKIHYTDCNELRKRKGFNEVSNEQSNKRTKYNNTKCE